MRWGRATFGRTVSRLAAGLRTGSCRGSRGGGIAGRCRGCWLPGTAANRGRLALGESVRAEHCRIRCSASSDPLQEVRVASEARWGGACRTRRPELGTGPGIVLLSRPGGGRSRLSPEYRGCDKPDGRCGQAVALVDDVDAAVFKGMLRVQSEVVTTYAWPIDQWRDEVGTGVEMVEGQRNKCAYRINLILAGRTNVLIGHSNSW